MKVCRECKFVGEPELFVKDRNLCKKCNNMYMKIHSSIPSKKAIKKITNALYYADPINNKKQKIYQKNPITKQRTKQTPSYKKHILDGKWGTKEEIQWALDVKTRDDYICLYCGDQYGNKEAHHQYSVKNYPELALVLNNGITLCKDCHRIETNRLLSGEFI